jgi:hypothetical protein
MSNVSRGLFDPRVKMQHWPEPNDDPNIPYAWGEGGLGYAISGFRPNESPIQPSPTETAQEAVKPKTVVKPVNLKSQPKEAINETVVSVAVASSMVLGVWGLLDGYSQSQNTGGERIFDSLEKAVVYATGVGFIASKLRKG